MGVSASGCGVGWGGAAVGAEGGEGAGGVCMHCVRVCGGRGGAGACWFVRGEVGEVGEEATLERLPWRGVLACVLVSAFWWVGGYASGTPGSTCRRCCCCLPAAHLAEVAPPLKHDQQHAGREAGQGAAWWGSLRGGGAGELWG